MKTIICALFLALASVPVFAQLKSSVIKNTAGTEVFAINYGSGVATVAVNGVVSVGVGIDATGAVDMDYGSADVTDHTFTSDGGTVVVDGTVSATAAVGSSGSLTATGSETNDAVLVLDADDGDDNADTWIIESETADNDLSFVNHTTEAMKISSAGAVTITDDLTVSGDLVTIGATQITFSAAAEVTAATNTASFAIPVSVNGTNYYINIYPN